ncbi:MAG: hypothetical protein MR599_09135 [Lactobacillus johnsonii]|nr:hypothetical protein [Lactobacillus johnsonii]MCI6763013.1 hypothetical protein [Lactobacillus johnsonii]
MMTMQYIYKDRTFELTEIMSESLTTLLDFHDLLVKFKDDISQLVGMQEEGRLLFMIMFGLKQSGGLIHDNYPIFIQPLVGNLINEMFQAIDICCVDLNEAGKINTEIKKQAITLLDQFDKVEIDRKYLIKN